MGRNKSVRFSAEDTFSSADSDLRSVSLTPDDSALIGCSPTNQKSILRRSSTESAQTSSSSASPTQDKPNSSKKGNCGSSLGRLSPKYRKEDPERKEEVKTETVQTTNQKLDLTSDTVVNYASPAKKDHLRWSSDSHQWFNNKSLTHRDSTEPIEVRVFKINTEEPKVNRWVGQPPSNLSKPQSFDFTSKNTVEQVNSLPKSGQASLYNKGSFSDFRYQTLESTNQQRQYTSQSAPSKRQSHTDSQSRHTELSNSTPVRKKLETYSTSAMSTRVYSPDAQPQALSLGSVYPPDSFSKSQAKAELQGISTRLGSYIQYVREISENANQVDLGAFVNSIRILEDELVGMKALYERELGNSRQESEDISRNKNQLQQEVNKLRQHVVELETRLGTETEKNRQAVAEIDSLQRTVMTRDREVTEAKLAIQRPITDLDDLSKEFNAVLREKEDIKRRYESEQLQRQEIADQHHQLSKKLDIDTQVHSQEAQDLTDRLNAASNTILTLESKIREMTHADTALSEMLQRVRAVAEDEIRRYQMDSEARFSQNVSELQSQLNECNRKIADLNERNQQLHTELGDYQSANRGLQGQVTSLEHQRRVLEDELCADRQRSHDHIKLLEAKLVQLQDNVINKMKELNAARDAQIPLKAEIETLRTMLEEEENRLKMPPTPRVDTSKPLPPPNVLSANFGNSASTTDAAPISSYSRGGVSQGRVFTQVSGGQRDESPRPLGPVRVRSAPVTKQHYVPTSLGQGKDYFDELFNDLRVREMREEQGLTNIIPAPPADNKEAERRGSGDQGSRVNSGVRSQEGSRASVAARSMDFTTYSASAVGDLRITEVDKEGFYIRLLNGAITKEADLGGYMIQQNVGGHPVSVYRFPPRTRVPASDTVTVWAACADTAKHCPPTDFYFREQEKWGTGPECTTIVCKPNGQAVAWTTNSHRVTPDAYTQSNDNTAQQPATTTGTEQLNEYTDCDKDADLPVYNMNVNAPPPEPVYLRREKAPAATLAAQKHPHGGPPSAPSHPGTGQARCLTLGNDNSSVNRQTRGHSIRPDPIPGAPYAGASAQRMGSASLRRYNSAAGTVRGSGAIANKSAGTIRYGPRSPFLSPLQQDYTLRQNTGATVLA